MHKIYRSRSITILDFINYRVGFINGHSYKDSRVVMEKMVVLQLV